MHTTRLPFIYLFIFFFFPKTPSTRRNYARERRRRLFVSFPLFLFPTPRFLFPLSLFSSSLIVSFLLFIYLLLHLTLRVRCVFVCVCVCVCLSRNVSVQTRACVPYVGPRRRDQRVTLRDPSSAIFPFLNIRKIYLEKSASVLRLQSTRFSSIWNNTTLYIIYIYIYIICISIYIFNYQLIQVNWYLDKIRYNYIDRLVVCTCLCVRVRVLCNLVLTRCLCLLYVCLWLYLRVSVSVCVRVYMYEHMAAHKRL